MTLEQVWIEPIKPMRFGTLWVGDSLSPMEQACLHTFVQKGESVTLFSYGNIANLPAGVEAGDANLIVDKKEINSFIFNGRPDLAHFSDYFRYLMIKNTGLCWIDSDIVLLGNFSSSTECDIFVGREVQGTINGPILQVYNKSLIDEILRKCEDLKGKDLIWGETGPLLIQSVLKSRGLDYLALNSDVFYPIDHDNIYKIFLPEHLEWCERSCSSASALHLFNNVIVRMGYWKSIAPPEGSFLYHCFSKVGALAFFSDIYPAKVMQNVVDNFRKSQTGDGLGFKAITKQLFPGFMRSFNHHSKKGLYI